MKKPSYEIWKKVPKEYLNYEVSSHGRLRRNGKILKQQIHTNGYKLCSLVTKDGKCKTRLVHRIVCLSFGVIEQKDIVNHIDGKKENNHISNLEKSSPKHNTLHAVRIGLIKPMHGELNGNCKLERHNVIRIITLYKSGWNTKQLSEKFKLGVHAIRNIVSRRSWKNINYEREVGNE